MLTVQFISYKPTLFKILNIPLTPNHNCHRFQTGGLIEEFTTLKQTHQWKSQMDLYICYTKEPPSLFFSFFAHPVEEQASRLPPLERNGGGKDEKSSQHYNIDTGRNPMTEYDIKDMHVDTQNKKNELKDDSYKYDLQNPLKKPKVTDKHVTPESKVDDQEKTIVVSEDKDMLVLRYD